MNHFIGCSGFSNKDWRGFFYPDNLPSTDYLSFYAQYFNSVEINSTFYRKPTIKTLNSWYEQTPANFLFFIKIPQTITHINQLKNMRQEINEFCKHISHGIKEKLGGFLFQFPPSFICDKENINNILNGLSPRFLNVVEFRHRTWWNDGIFEVLREHGIIFCGVSIPKDIPDNVIINNTDTIYYRLHGKPILFKSEYSETELQALSEKIITSNKNAFVFFNNTWGIAAIKNARYMQKLLANSPQIS
ncbi:DUF72 domain-containing protein [Emticicia sp. BO119]|uniref:DUF72 domain-containing protein n=1 Tax=Emticicia sp. BO119 TaxID=2757768 RepID=UPI0015F019B5|nr:DUF72 domain-containing protein [Emticicia sp. BO119]MBA4853817.1 DUF72 domain-containing protein [Emticicia sp. BO119]